jgi:hypothetical protein
MNKRLLAGIMIGTALAGAAAAPASARDGWSPGAAAAVGVLGGLAVGSAIAGASNGYYPGKPVYVAPRPAPVYREVAPAYVEHCYVERERVWVPGWGWEMRRRRICE